MPPSSQLLLPPPVVHRVTAALAPVSLGAANTPERDTILVPMARHGRYCPQKLLCRRTERPSTAPATPPGSPCPRALVTIYSAPDEHGDSSIFSDVQKVTIYLGAPILSNLLGVGSAWLP